MGPGTPSGDAPKRTLPQLHRGGALPPTPSRVAPTQPADSRTSDEAAGAWRPARAGAPAAASSAGSPFAATLAPGHPQVLPPGFAPPRPAAPLDPAAFVPVAGTLHGGLIPQGGGPSARGVERGGPHGAAPVSQTTPDTSVPLRAAAAVCVAAVASAEHVPPAGLGAGALLGERYRLIDRLGRGGMGEVWRARHEVLRRDVAIKLLSPARELDPEQAKEQVGRFIREARAVATLHHPHVVQISDFGHAPDGTPYFVMELLTGRTLDRVIADEGRVAWSRAQVLLAQIADALHAAHELGIIHRDLKPSNVFVCAGAGGESIKLIDFGIAKLNALDPDATRFTKTGVVQGTPAFMAPEQARGEPIDGRVDVYALGCLAYQLVTGSRVFRSSNRTQILYQHLFESPEPPRERCPEAAIPAAAEAVILRALCKDPALRFPSMAAMRDAIAAADHDARPIALPAEVLPQPPKEIQTRFFEVAPAPSDAGTWPPHAAARAASVESTAELRRGRAGARAPLGIAAVAIGVMVAGAGAWAWTTTHAPAAASAAPASTPVAQDAASVVPPPTADDASAAPPAATPAAAPTSATAELAAAGAPDAAMPSDRPLPEPSPAPEPLPSGTEPAAPATPDRSKPKPKPKPAPAPDASPPAPAVEPDAPPVEPLEPAPGPGPKRPRKDGELHNPF